MPQTFLLKLRHNRWRRDFRPEVSNGEDLMASWESSPGVRRFFAQCCGLPIYRRDDAYPHELEFRLCTLDTDPHMRAGMHYLIGSKAPWVEIADSLPKEPGGPPFVTRD